MLHNYFKIAYRNILKNKIYSAINIFGFSAGLASFILIAIYVQYEFSYDKYHENADRLFRVVRDKPSGESGEIVKTSVTPTPLAPLLKSEFPEIISAARIIKSTNVLISYQKNHFLEEKVHWSDSETFDLFTIPFITGNSKTALDDPYSVLLSESTARKYFGDENPIGKTVSVYGQHDFKVTGVFENMPVNSHFIMDIVFPIKTYFIFAKREMTSWQGNFIYTYILLDQNADEKELAGKFPALLDKHIYQAFKIDLPEKFRERLVLQPLTDIHLHSQRNQEMETNGNFSNVIMMGSLAVLFLMITCINYINLSTARSGQRSKEVGLRKVVGARRIQLMGQFFSESMILTIVAFLIALILAALALPYFNDLIGRPLSLNPFAHPLLPAGLLILIVIIGFVAGSVPAVMISGFMPIKVLRGSFASSPKGSMLRNGLVMTQFTITIIFLAFTLIAKDQIRFILHKDAGYDKDQIITVKVQDNNLKKNMETVKTELLRYPGVIKVSASYRLPNNIDEHQGYSRPGSSSDRRFMIYYNFADYDFADLYGIEIVKGRNFSRSFPSDAGGAYLINEAAVQAAGWDDPIGQEFTDYREMAGKIVGVMKDFHIRSMHFPIEPVYIRLSPGQRISFLSIKISPDNIPESIGHIERVMKKFSPDYPFEYSFFDEVFAAQYGHERRMTAISTAFSVLAVIVACLGLLGLAAFAAERRTKEIGVRKLLGASVPDIFTLLSKEFLKWVVLANIIAWPVAYYIMRNWLNDFAYRVDIGWWIFALSGSIALMIAMATVCGQSIKAAYRNPVESLRYE